jgi:hypothetical protein
MITAYSDADLGGPELKAVSLCTGAVPDCKSTTGYAICINGNLVIFRSRKQRCTAVSSTETEILAASDCLTDMLYLFEILSFLVNLFPSKRLETEYFGGNENTIRVLTSGYLSTRTRHVAIRLSHVLDSLSRIDTRVAHVRSADNPSDVLTKHLPSKQHRKLLQVISFGVDEAANDENTGVIDKGIIRKIDVKGKEENVDL